MNTFCKRGVLTLLLGYSACGAWAQQASFHIQEFSDTVAYIGYHFGEQKYIHDTLEVSEGRFSFDQKNAKPGLYFVYTPQYFLEFVLDKQPFTIRTSQKGGYQEMTVEGSRENELFRQFQVGMGTLQRAQRELLEQLKAGTLDTLSAQQRQDELKVKGDSIKQQLIAASGAGFVAALMQLTGEVPVPRESADGLARYMAYKRGWFGSVDLSNPALLRTPVMHHKVTQYLDQVVVQHPDTLIQEIDWLFNQLGSDQEVFRYWLVTLFKKYAEPKIMGMDAVTIHLIEKYYLTGRADWISAEYRKKLQEEVAYVKPNLLGSYAPVIEATDTLGQPFSWAMVQEPYVLLFIYDPDCGHCKKAHEELLEKENELLRWNVQVVMLSTITDTEKWKKFVTKSNPIWLHLTDLTGRGYFRVSYNVRTTPKIYLLDEKRRIVAKQLELDQILDFLEHAQK